MDEYFTKEQQRAARRAAKALKELSDSGIYLIAYCTGTIYGYKKEDISFGAIDGNAPYLDCGHINDMGDYDTY